MQTSIDEITPFTELSWGAERAYLLIDFISKVILFSFHGKLSWMIHRHIIQKPLWRIVWTHQKFCPNTHATLWNPIENTTPNRNKPAALTIKSFSPAVFSSVCVLALTLTNVIMAQSNVDQQFSKASNTFAAELYQVRNSLICQIGQRTAGKN